MNIKKIAVGVSVGALMWVGSLIPAFATGNNGSFETGTDPGMYLTLNSGNSTDINNWTVDSGNVDYVGSYWKASDGNRSIDLNGFEKGSVSQVLNTVVGATYHVSFDLSGNPDSRPSGDSYFSPNDKVVRVSATGATSQDFNFDTSTMANSLSNMEWQNHIYTFVANTTSTTLTFASQIDGAFGPAIDNIKIEEILPVVRSATITSPTVGDHDKGNISFQAYLTDDEADGIQWAVRKGTCAANTGTIFGNVDGHHDIATIDTSDLSHQTFSFTGDMSNMDPGMYCFVYNPTEDAGESDIRLTRQFNLIEPLTTPTDKDQCKKDGWKTFNNPSFKNQGQCVSFVEANEHANKDGDKGHDDHENHAESNDHGKNKN